MKLILYLIGICVVNTNVNLSQEKNVWKFIENGDTFVY